ncbi:MAG: hypothetical protein DRR08_04735 [Candidatus Parabeggiatoa sp. nov. 2]|nr:MAG: hypothetical protein B6247_12525 [Beggiatoa sp. 4572_84]RKZ62969.1 MAG: hypothetical protein DRR08_04735 [Gammaproteobacteria bacterium]
MQQFYRIYPSTVTVGNVVGFYASKVIGVITKTTPKRQKNAVYVSYRLNVGITFISWGAAPGYINIAPLGLEGSYTGVFLFLKKSNLFPS